MLNLYDTITSPGATVVKLLTGRRSPIAKAHTSGGKTETHLLHIVEPATDAADSATQTNSAGRVRRAA